MFNVCLKGRPVAGFRHARMSPLTCFNIIYYRLARKGFKMDLRAETFSNIKSCSLKKKTTEFQVILHWHSFTAIRLWERSLLLILVPLHLHSRVKCIELPVHVNVWTHIFGVFLNTSSCSSPSPTCLHLWLSSSSLPFSNFLKPPCQWCYLTFTLQMEENYSHSSLGIMQSSCWHYQLIYLPNRTCLAEQL